ncbi:unnamed protein product [Brassica oleracea var. botrytis]
METIPVSAESFKVGLIGAGKMAEIIDREESFIEFWISSLCSNISGQILASLVMNPPKIFMELNEGRWVVSRVCCRELEGGSDKAEQRRRRRQPEHQEACEGWFMLEHQQRCLRKRLWIPRRATTLEGTKQPFSHFSRLSMMLV